MFESEESDPDPDAGLFDDSLQTSETGVGSAKSVHLENGAHRNHDKDDDESSSSSFSPNSAPIPLIGIQDDDERSTTYSYEQGEQEEEDHPFTTINIAPSDILINEIIQGLRSNDPVQQLHACEKLLMPSSPSLHYALLDAIIEAGLIGRVLILALSWHPTTPTPASESNSTSQSKLQTAATWVIATLARTESKMLVVDLGAIPKLLQILRYSENGGTASIPAAYALSSLAVTSGGKDKRLFVDEIRDAGLIPILQKMVTVTLENGNATNSLNLPLILALTKLCKSLCYVPKNVRVTLDRMQLLQTLCCICDAMPDSELEIMYHCAWALYYLTKNGKEETIQSLITHGNVIPKLVRAVGNLLENRRILRPFLNVVGNVISSTRDSHTDSVIFAGILPHLHQLILDHEWTGEVNWIVSNISAGNATQIEQLFQAGFFALIIDVFRSGNLAGRKEAVFTIVNIMDKGSLQHKQFLIGNNILPLLIALVKEHPHEVLAPVTEAIYLLVKAFQLRPITSDSDHDETTTLSSLLNQSGTLAELSKYQDNDDPTISDRVQYILDVGLNNLMAWQI